MAGCAGVFCNCMNLGVASIIDIGFSGGPSNNYPSWLDGLSSYSSLHKRYNKPQVENPDGVV